VQNDRAVIVWSVRDAGMLRIDIPCERAVLATGRKTSLASGARYHR
jgi:hypothetical protein